MVRIGSDSLTQKNNWDRSPAWSLDGKKIAFAREYRDVVYYASLLGINAVSISGRRISMGGLR